VVVSILACLLSFIGRLREDDLANVMVVFLTNTTPARCHIHTTNRLPNRGDYGRALLEQNGLAS
jgi:hypothetical protein